MNRFSNLMDDMKTALTISGQFKGLFLPAIIANVLLFIMGIGAIIVMVITVAGTFAAMEYMSAASIVGLVLMVLAMFLVTVLVFAALDMGITNIVIKAVDGEKPTAAIFFEGIRKHFFPVILTRIVLWLIYTVVFTVLLIPIILYALTAGILTGGWAMLLMSCTFQALIGYWLIIKMEDQRSGFDSVGVNIGFGRKYYWLMVLIIYLQMAMANYLPNLLGIIGAALGAVFVSYVVATFFKIVILLTYRRYRDSLTMS